MAGLSLSDGRGRSPPFVEPPFQSDKLLSKPQIPNRSHSPTHGNEQGKIPQRIVAKASAGTKDHENSRHLVLDRFIRELGRADYLSWPEKSGAILSRASYLNSSERNNTDRCRIQP